MQRLQSLPLDMVNLDELGPLAATPRVCDWITPVRALHGRHGDRFRMPSTFVYVSKWLRAKLWKKPSEYGRAWFAGFPRELWPAEEEQTDDGRIFLRLKEGSKVLATG